MDAKKRITSLRMYIERLSTLVAGPKSDNEHYVSFIKREIVKTEKTIARLSV